MAITTIDQLLAGLTVNRQKFFVSKASLSSQISGGTSSYWRQGNVPGIGNIPTTAATCNNTTLGTFTYVNPPTGSSTYLARATISSTQVQGIEIHDRLAHMGGLVGNVTTAQTVGLDLAALGSVDNIGTRKGRGDYANTQWWVEWYASTGATAATATFTYTDHLGNSGKTAAVAIPTNSGQGRMIQIMPQNGDNIRSVDTVQLSVSTGTAGNFGVTATLQRSEIVSVLANVPVVYDWALLGLPPIYDSSCLVFMSNNSSTTPGTINGAITLIQG